MKSLNFIQWRNRCLSAILLIALFLTLALHLAQPINLTATDIGRHIKNGEMVLQGNFQVLHSNFYSFTYPDYPFINHHWFFGVCAYEIWKYVGFIGLSVIYILVVLASLFFFLRAALLRGHFALAVFFAFLALPLLYDRREIRPEGISILFMGVYFYLLTKLSLGKIPKGIVFIILGIVQIIWVNTHIFFFMGPLLIGFFLWEGYSRGCTVCVRNLRPLLVLTVLVSFLNPSGLAGALTPFNIFKGFGYRLAENQNLFFMMSFFPHERIYLYYLTAVGVLAVGIIFAVVFRGWKINGPFIALTAFVALAGIKAIRLMTPFGFFLIPFGCFFYSKIEGRLQRKAQNYFRAIAMTAAVGLAVVSAVSLKERPLGFGLMPGINDSAEFFKQTGIKGPVFSNYDIGGYLIFHLFPREKVFVDNRQEAFPPDFFKDVYIPMQEKTDTWEKVSNQYGFNAIYFYRHDLTPWGQDFMIERVKDPAWAPVFVDGYTIIFLKRNAQNQNLIEQFELPKSIFKIT